MHKIILLAISSLFLFSCSSNGGLAVPGEKGKIKNNISYEYYQIAEGYYGLKNYTKACEYYNLAGENEEYKVACKYKLARCYAMIKDWSTAEKLYSELLKLDSDNTDLRLSIAYIYAMDGKTEKSIDLYKSLYEQYPENQPVLENYISLLMSLEKNDDAKLPYETLKEKFPDSKIVSKYQDTFKEPEKTSEQTDEPELNK